MPKPKSNAPPPKAVVQPRSAAVPRPAPPVFRVPPSARSAAPPVYRPGTGAPQLKPAPPVYRPVPAGVQRKISAEQAEEIARANPMTVNDLRAYTTGLYYAGKMPAEYEDSEEERLMIGKAIIKIGLEPKKKKEADDITSEYNARYACVLQAVIYIKGTVFGKSSPKDLHDLIWSDKSKAQFKQYDDDSVTPAFYRAAGLNPVAYPEGSTMDDLPGSLAIGKYAVGVKGTVEDHMYILEKTGKSAFAWKEFDQINFRGFKDARINKAGLITSVSG
jgi:hypothetical protein